MTFYVDVRINCIRLHIECYIKLNDKNLVTVLCMFRQVGLNFEILKSDYCAHKLGFLMYITNFITHEMHTWFSFM